MKLFDYKGRDFKEIWSNQSDRNSDLSNLFNLKSYDKNGNHYHNLLDLLKIKNKK